MVNQLDKNFPTFMEPEGLSSCSHEPVTDSYPESAESRPHLPLFSS